MIDPVWQVAIGGLIAALSGWGTQLLAAHTGRAQWLAEQRLGAYAAFFNEWEDCKKAITSLADDDEIESAVARLQEAARSIDLLGDDRSRNAAWSAVAALENYRLNSLDRGALDKQINRTLNEFKNHLGVQRQRRL